MEQEQEQDKKCWYCEKPGGRRRLDPYAEEIQGERIVRRFHEHCLQERRDDI